LPFFHQETFTITCCCFFADVNDNAPSFASFTGGNPYLITQPENITIGTVVGTVSATDDDIGPAGL